MDFKQSVVRCLRDQYADFGGRAGRAEFWYFMLACLLADIILTVLRLDLVATLVTLGLIIPSCAVATRRLHDVGKNGWMQLVGLIPIVGWILVIWWLTLPSVGPNQYGDGPATAAATTALPPGAA
jgi:uncharacterized membrane protein YhaH (DUF805 family)